MTARNASRVTPRDIARILFRHWRKMILFFCGVIGLTLLAISLYPRSYASESKLLIRVGRESVGLDPTATTGETIMLQKSQVDEVNSALNLLSSREIFQRAVEKIGAERILDELNPTTTTPAIANSFVGRFQSGVELARTWVATVLKDLRLSDPGTAEELAIRQLENGVRVWAPKQSTIISISYNAATPELAHDVVAAVTEAFLEQHLQLSHTEGSLEFFAEQVATLHQELGAKQTELRDRKNEFQLSSSESGRLILEQQIGNVELDLLQAQRELAFSKAAITHLTSAIEGLDPELVTNRVAGFPNEAKDGMREKLYELELRENELKSRYTEEYPLLVEVQKQRQEAEAILAGLPDARTQTTAALNLNQRKLELELAQTKANKEALRARHEAAELQRGTLIAELKRLNDHELQLAELERNVELLDGKYRLHVEKMEEARVNEAMGRDGIQNVKVAQPATLDRKPIWPKKQLILGFGMILATGGALSLAYLAETLDQTLRTTNQVEARLGLPVLVSLPYRKRKRRLSRAAKSANAISKGQPRHEHLGNYRSLVRELLPRGDIGDRQAKTVGIVGCDATKLRSRVAADLAVQCACSGADPVLLIDADSRRRRIAKRFRVSGSPGWRDVMAGAADAESCIHRPRRNNLAVMSPGGSNGNATATRAGIGVLGQLDEIKAEYGLVVVDLPPAGEMDAPVAAADWLDELVLVVEAEHTRIQVAQHAKEVLKRAGVHLKGVVLVNRREYIPRWLYRRL